ncbi:Zinc finger MYM-type protein 1 [Cyphomyrmex costatus]|uniref:Zinc finger MYM-type protein 1 n=1 Tax=Cyphomyrmex costatus TaxID=456900 RepID=A0A151IAV6_9HYME|nr:Zinc finger MYM-type protein 1 [Cyphomyrmex costatus]
MRSGARIKGQKRTMSTAWFYRQLNNGEKVLRTWMVYSMVNESLHCFCCRLFASNDLKYVQNAFVRNGFQQWWKLYPKVKQHENNSIHVASFEKWKEMEMRIRNRQTIDRSLQDQIKKEMKNWIKVLERILDAIMFLAKQNLPFRGHRESIDNINYNSGNFLELIKLIGKYDPVMKEHLVSIHSAHQTHLPISYLSPQIQNEFITLLARCVKDKILSEIRKAKYYAILFDSTPDVAHIDQMTEIIRYVKIDGDKVEVQERFLGFLPMKEKSAEKIAEMIVTSLDEDKLLIENCRGQGYDNAATMSGIHRRVQQRIKDINPKAEFISCTNHSLNLTCVHAAGQSVYSTTFFGTIEDVLKQTVPVTVKRVIETRWSAKHDAVKIIKSHYANVLDALEVLMGQSENADTLSDAGVVYASTTTFPFLCYLHLWSKILPEIDKTQKYLQTNGLGLDQSVIAINALASFFSKNRDSLVDKVLTDVQVLCEQMEIPITKHIRRKKKMIGEKEDDAGLLPQQEIRRDMLESIDRLNQEITQRFEQLNLLNERFGFLNLKILLDEGNDEYIKQKINDLRTIYNDIDSDDLKSEVERLRRLVSSCRSTAQDTDIPIEYEWSAETFLAWIVRWGFTEMLPNLTVVLRIFLTISVSVATCERSFSKLKLIKTYLCSTMSQMRLNGLALLSIERDLTKDMKFTDVIKEFASTKVRKIRI